MQDPKRVEKLEQEIADLRGQLGSFVNTQTRTLERVEDALGKVNGHVADVMYELGGAPDHKFREKDRPTIRSRLHNLENDKNASRIASEALAKASETLDEAKKQAWTRGQKIGLFVFAAVGAVGIILNLAGVGG